MSASGPGRGRAVDPSRGTLAVGDTLALPRLGQGNTARSSLTLP